MTKYPNDIKMTNTELIDTIKTILEFSSSLDQNILTEEVPSQKNTIYFVRQFRNS